MSATDPGLGFIVLTKFEKKLKEGSGKVDAKGKIATPEWEHQPVVLNAAHMVAIEKVTVVDKSDKMSMAQCTLIKMFGMADVAVLETVETILQLIKDAGFTVRDARD